MSTEQTKSKILRHTARGIVVKDQQILLMERWRDDLHYFSIPGGGIEKGETAEQTVVREILEETSIQVKVIRKIYEMHDPAGHIHLIFLCEYVSGNPQLQEDSEEAKQSQRTLGQQRYNPRWIEFTAINKLPFLYWKPVARQLKHDIKTDWPDKPIKLHADN